MNISFFKIIAPIAAIFSFRMLGLFMLIPVFTIYATTLDGATPALMGIALGSYGLSQGLMQIPFGLLSDRYGRKPILTIGLAMFAVGSLIGALSHSITGMIIARIIQGTGAIGSVLMALLADLTSERQRTFAMAIIGMSIGLSFSIAFIVSPIIAAYTGLAGIFYITVFLALLALFLLYTVIPATDHQATHIPSLHYRQRLKHVLIDRHLQNLNLGIFSQHFILTATFFVIPLKLQHIILSSQTMSAWQFYLPILVLAFFLMIPIIVFAERKQQTKPVFIAAIIITGLSQLGWLCVVATKFTFSGLMLVYFVAFNTLEAMLPSLISKQASAHNKGTAMGVYSSCQFLGIFAGGATAGILYQYHGASAIFAMNLIIALAWGSLSMLTQHKNRHKSSSM